jgi:hypothetical protein
MAAFANSTTDFLAVAPGSAFSWGSGGVVGDASLVTMLGFNGGGLVTGNLGTMSFSTGALLSSSGSVETFAGGGSFMITGNGKGGTPDGVIFSGTFSGPVTVMQVGTGTNNVHEVLVCEGACSLTGTWLGSGKTVSGSLYLVDEHGLVIAATSFDAPVVPEPGTLSLLGTGLLGLGALVRRRIKA